MDTKVLADLGLLNNEIKVYLYLLKTGPSLASEIAKETKLHRTHVYDILEALIKKSMVSHIIRGRKKYFQPVSPDRFKLLLDAKQEQLEKDKEKLAQLIQELKKISTIAKPQLLVSVYEGREGFKALLEDILRRKQDYLVIGYNPKADEYLKYFLPGFYKRRVKLGVKRRAIVDPSFRGSWVHEQKLQEIRFFKYYFPGGIIIYGNRVVITIIQPDGQVAIVMDNQRIADNFRKLFESLWEQAEI